MRKVTSYKCPHCGMSFTTLTGWGNHIQRLHPDTIPEGYSIARYFYYVDTGKTHGTCVQCKQPTDWNEATFKYKRYCNNPKCKQDYCKEAKKRMVDKYGKTHLLNDPTKQREMLAARSKMYRFKDGGSISYLSSYERDFLMTCDNILGLTSKDILGPSPNTYIYMYKGEAHFYIPDYFIPDLNLEIEIKDGGDNCNNHPHMQVDRAKEELKDMTMAKNPSVNYFKVVNEKYDDFFKFILDCKNAIDDDMLDKVQKNIVNRPATESITPAALKSMDIQKYDGKDYYPLYIILMSNKSILGDTIRSITGEGYSHSAISFSPEMDDIYTFGNKIIKKGEYTRRSFGSGRESFRHDSFKFSYPEHTKCGIYCMFFNKKQITAIRKRINDIFDHDEQYHYNIIGLIKYIFGVSSTDPYKLFCSQFVAMILQTGKKDILDRDPSLYSPYGITEIEGVLHLANCTIGTYKKDVIIRETKKAFDHIVKSNNLSALEAVQSAFINECTEPAMEVVGIKIDKVKISADVKKEARNIIDSKPPVKPLTSADISRIPKASTLHLTKKHMKPLKLNRSCMG